MLTIKNAKYGIILKNIYFILIGTIGTFFFEKKDNTKWVIHVNNENKVIINVL